MNAPVSGTKPLAGTVRLYLDGVEQLSGWSIDATRASSAFTCAPAAGVEVSGDFEFDVPGRFNVDQWRQPSGPISCTTGSRFRSSSCESEIKSISVALAQHLAGEVTTLASLWKVRRRDGQIFGFTDHDRDLVQAGGGAGGQRALLVVVTL